MTRNRDYELDAWLGEAADEMTDEQYETMRRIADEAGERWADTDDDTASQVMSGALMVILGADTVRGLGQQLQVARDAEQRAMSQLYGALMAASAEGTSEVQLAEQAGVTRVTVRRALGKSVSR